MSDDKDKKPQTAKPEVQSDKKIVSLNAEQPRVKLKETPPPPKPKP